MTNEVEYVFPAGDESDGSNDEWDIGYSTPNHGSSKQEADAVVPDNEDNVSTLKRAINEGDVEIVQKLLDMGKLFKTVLMAACTASTREDKILKCVELLLSRNADPNTFNGSRMTPLMLAARDGYSLVINLLVSHGAEVNAQDANGYTPLAMAVQYGREEAVLKLLQLGADKSIKTKTDKFPMELAKDFKMPQIARILACSATDMGNEGLISKEETLFKFFKKDSEAPASSESMAKLCDVELLLHGLNLEYLSDIMVDNDITWSYLLDMEQEDLEKIGITDPEDQRKILNAVKQMHLDRVDFDTLSQLENIDTGSEELYNFLISLRQQFCYLTETVQDVISRLPLRPSELVLSLDPKNEAQAICNELVVLTGDLQKEVACLGNLLRKMDQVGDSCPLPPPCSRGNWSRPLLKGLTLSMLGGSLLFIMSRASCFKVHL